MSRVESNVCSRLVLPVLFILILFANAACQEHSYDIRRYDLAIEPNFDTKALYLTAKVAISNPKLEKAFSFGLSDQYGSVTVTSNVSPVTFERDRGSITVALEKPAADVELVFQIRGVPGKSADENLDVVADSSLFLLWSDRFYPIDFDDWALVRTKLTVPLRFKVIAPGKLLEVDRSGGAVEYTFQTSAPTVCFSVMADSRWIRTERKIRFLYMQTFLYPQCQKYAEQIFSTSYDIISLYSQTYCLYPSDQFTFATIAGMNARRAFPGFVAYSPEYLTKEFTTTGHDAHETALLWWDYTIRGTGPGAFQWTEGFGDHAEFLYDEAKGKPIPAIFETFRDKYLSMPVEQDRPYYELNGNVPQEIIHGKYPWMMRVMRYVVGDAAFKKAMSLLFYKFRFDTFSMEEFVSTMEKGSGQSLKWWREEWLERKGAPTISLRSETRQDKDGYQISVLVKQVGAIYHLPIEIGIKTTKGLRVEKVNMSLPEATFTFRSEEKPEDVLLDPNGWILMRKIYEK